jgi:hypothetical protein
MNLSAQEKILLEEYKEQGIPEEEAVIRLLKRRKRIGEKSYLRGRLIRPQKVNRKLRLRLKKEKKKCQMKKTEDLHYS